MVSRSSLESLVAEVGNALKQHNKLIVTAESCTGGLIAEALTSVAGSTAWFDRAYITYSYESKREMLGVHETTIQHKGAVSQECVEEMVIGALQESHATVSVACSGIAGPGGGTPDKPVGTVWISWAVQGHDEVVSKLYHFDGDRNAVRLACTVEALKGVLSILEEV
ncbi:Nicotinamide-nucleotide amidohydrolase PncC [Hydrogenovibrio crunogenus]|uniref:Nicotinamide-nucleotide amidohydrolase PncC n=1 Tax=Hydrogenovibrio crunogenus TaxID=39765 RepID=A0A4P7P1B7_9GAMM|nr:CinA family protein [Hydrogenovibrio crunogenus]QBZ83625.1 Nicotinamide-nucleotide amidohydrolase PncC [Hydrogenovibrio crunogenus]RUM92308.1 MAG: damage-inducible protein CinA [Thiomicrospira sp.]